MEELREDLSPLKASGEAPFDDVRDEREALSACREVVSELAHPGKPSFAGSHEGKEALSELGRPGKPCFAGVAALREERDELLEDVIERREVLSG